MQDKILNSAIHSLSLSSVITLRLNKSRCKMKVQTLDKTQPHSARVSIQSIWGSLTEPTTIIKNDDKPKARVLSAVMLAFFLLGIFATFISPIAAFVSGDPVTTPALTSIIALGSILCTYFISRSRYYRFAAWIAILIPPITILYPILSTGIVTSIASVFYLAVSVILAGLLLSSKETFAIGIIIALLILLLPEAETTTTSTTSQNITAFSFIIMTTFLIGLVGRSREYYVKLLEASQANLLDANANLEQRVTNRTLELQESRDEALSLQRLAQENSRLKSEFLSTMSHELRTPLNAIEGFTSIMLSGMGIELSPRAEDMVKRVSSNSKRLLHLINDFLDLSRIEADRLEMIKEPISLERLTQKWQNQVGILAEEKKIDFVVTVSPDLPSMILSDEDVLSKIGINLLSNAFKFTHEGQVSLDLQRSNGDWTISVRDTGIGIPIHAREYIFDEFRQVDGSSKRLYGGTGLGLSLVQKLVRAMDGNVSLQSEVDTGSTFTVTLPLEVSEGNQKGVIL